MKQGPFLQPVQGMALGTLLRVLNRNGFRVDTRCLPRLGYLVVVGTLNSAYGFCETMLNGRAIEAAKIEHPPLFIIGHWRSGTTHLHNLLSFDENLSFPTAYQALFPGHFIFSGLGGTIFNHLAPKSRPMDNVPFSAGVPHEDEFALAAHCAVSPYVRILFPVTGDNGCAELDPKRLPREALQQWKDSLIHFLKKVTLCYGGRVVLKSPPHLGRVSTLLELFPGAQFIHIVRDPYMVYLSTRKLWRDYLSYGHLQIPDPHEADELILSWYSQLFSLFHRDKHLLGPGVLHEMKYEDLEKDPLASLEDLYGELRLPGFDRFRKRVAPYIGSIKGYQKNTYHLDDETREKVRRRWYDTFERYGYPV
ncbi:MAG: sulfotransferase [Deltaproteobacteria bacterium]